MEVAVEALVMEADIMESDTVEADIMEATMGVTEVIEVIITDIPILEVMAMATGVTSIEVAAIHAIQA